MHYCVQCGAAYEGDARFCVTCGGDLHAELAAFGMSPAPVAETLRFSCDGEGQTLLILYLKTFVLSLLTLGVYSFWGRADIRRYLFQSVRAGEDRFQYHGTGGELFRGWLKAAGIVAVLYCVFFVFTFAGYKVLAVAVLYGGILLLLPLAIVGAMRFRMSRTSLRGVHFSSRAEVGEFAGIYFKGLLLTVVTIGLYSPWFTCAIRRYLMRTTYYGDRPFDFDGEGGPLLKPMLISIVLLIPTLYISLIWYHVRQQNYFAAHTSFGQARFNSQMRTGELLGLLFTNLLLTVFTLGIGAPWARLRWIRYECEMTTLENFAGFEGIQQRASYATATGEGVANILEMDSDAGGGFGI